MERTEGSSSPSPSEWIELQIDNDRRPKSGRTPLVKFGVVPDLARLASGLFGAGKCPQMSQRCIKRNGKRCLVLERLRHEQTTLQ